jgi:hypothetical protein
MYLRFRTENGKQQQYLRCLTVNGSTESDRSHSYRPVWLADRIDALQGKKNRMSFLAIARRRYGGVKTSTLSGMFTKYILYFAFQASAACAALFKFVPAKFVFGDFLCVI